MDAWKYFSFTLNYRKFISYALNIINSIYDSRLIKKCEIIYFQSKNE